MAVFPERFELGQNYPNPFNPSTIIPYQLAASTRVRLEIFNILGQRVKTLVDGERTAGFHTARWDATDAAGQAVGAGIYFYRLKGGGVHLTRRMLLIDGQAGIPSAVPGGPPAAVLEAEETTPALGLAVSGAGLVPYVDPAFRVEAGMAPVDIVVEASGGIRHAKVASGGVLGDVDNNGRVDIFDALLVAVYSANPSLVMPNNGDITLGDVNRDGQTDLTDAYHIATYITDPSDPTLPPGIGEALVQGTGTASLSPLPSTVSFQDDGVWHRFTVQAGESIVVVANPTGTTPRVEINNLSNTNYCPAEANDDLTRQDGQDLVLAGCSPGTGTVELRRASDQTVLQTYTFTIQRQGTGGGDGGNAPDLIVDAPTVTNSSPAAGASFTLRTTVRNQGTGRSGSTTLRYYRSTDATVSTSDTQVGTDPVSSLSASRTSSESISLRAPSTTGTYYYGACVESVSGETNTGNNCSAAVTVTVGAAPAPDLVVDAPTVTNSSPAAGASFTLRATVRNQGAARSSSTTLRYYRSTDATVSTSDTQVGTDPVSSLSASRTSSESISLRAPSSAGTYYYGACVESVSGETNTGNNCSPAITVTVPGTVTQPTPQPGASKLYWSDWGTDKIQRANLDGSGVEDLISGAGLNGPDGLSLDLAGGKIYWADAGTNKIQRANLDGSNVEDLVTGLGIPYGLALHMAGGKMYWTNRQTGKIQRANLDGSGVEDLVTSGLTFPGALALDVGGGKMYWTNPGATKIQRANLSGSNVEDLVTSGLSSPTGLALDVGGGKMYWTDRGTDKIQRANLSGSGVEDLVTSGLNSPNGLALDVAGGKMYWADAGTDKVQRANLNGSGVEDLLIGTDGLVDPSGIAIGGTAQTGSGGGGGGGGGTSSAPDLVVDAPTVTNSSPTAGASFTLSATVRNQGTGRAGSTTLRYYRSTDATVSTGDTEVGTDPVSTLSASRTSSESIFLSAPSNAGTYYYGACVESVSDETDTGNNCSSAVTVTVGAAPAPDLVVDSPSVTNSSPTAGASFTLSATVRNQGNGQSAATTLRYYRSTNATVSTSDTEVGTDPVSTLSASRTSSESISLRAPSTTGTYYYGACVESVSGETDTGNNCSSAVTVTVPGTVTQPDPQPSGASKLYWSDWGTDKIQRADLDGSNVEDLVAGAGLNGPDGLSLDLAGGKIYWADAGTNKIQRANLDGSGVEDLVTGLGIPYGLALDLAGGKMYWTNRQTGKIQRANLNGSGVEDLVTSGLTFPGALALDAAGGKMYWTNPGATKIQRANLSGSGVEDLVTSGLSSPTGLALDAAGGKMYWTDRGTDKIQRANLSGSGVEDLVTSGLNSPNGLALDVAGGKMYWADAGTDKVQRANLNGSGVEDLLTSTDGLVDPSGIAIGGTAQTGSGGGGGGGGGTSSAPDLVVDAPTVTNSSPTAGASFTLSATVRNQGTGRAGSTTLRYYRSSDATVSTSDTEVGTDPVSTLSASRTGSESIFLSAPSSAGTYYYGACVESVSDESDTGNNCSSAVTVTVGAAPAPDLVVDAPTVTDSSPTAGASFTLRATVRNQGTGRAGSTTLRYYRSSDATVSTSDTEVGTDPVSTLSASRTSSESISLRAPSTTGTYYYGACVESVSDESDTGNNCSSAVTVTVGAAPAPQEISSLTRPRSPTAARRPEPPSP